MLDLRDLINGTKKLHPNMYRDKDIGRVRFLDAMYNAQNKALLIKYEAFGQSGSLYLPTFQFFKVDAADVPDPSRFVSHDKRNNMHYIKPLTTRHPVQVRCNCQWYRFAFAYWNHKEGSLLGGPFPKYIRKTATRPEVNPLHTPGICKHLFMTYSDMLQRGIIVSK